MSPAGARARQVVLLSLAAVAVGAGLLFLVVRYASQHPDQANLGNEVIRLDAGRTAKRIRSTGPYPLQDPNGDRDVYLQHVGDDAFRGWVLVLAYPPGERCAVVWDVKREVFQSPCTKRMYPPDGSGLTTYPVPVEGGRVVIDLRSH
jgi:hypothetical protein